MFFPNAQADNDTALVQMMAWGRTGGNALFEAMMAQVGEAYMRHSASAIR